jgi:S1-C subfamily serine protease
MKTILLILMALASVVIASYADDAQPSSYVATAKSSIVSIVETNSETGQWWEGTGWFIDANRIVTNDHVVNQEEESYDRTTIVTSGRALHPESYRLLERGERCCHYRR